MFGRVHDARTRYYAFYPEGKRQAPPDATLKAPVELMPQVDSIPATGHSEAACADETDAPGAAMTMTKANAFGTRRKSPSISSFNPQRMPVSGRHVDLDQRGFGQDSDISARLHDVRFTPLKS